MSHFKIVSGPEHQSLQATSSNQASCSNCTEHLLLDEFEWRNRGFSLKRGQYGKAVAHKYHSGAKCNVGLYSRSQVRPTPPPSRRTLDRIHAEAIIESVGQRLAAEVRDQIDGNEIWAVDLKGIVNKTANRLFIELTEGMDLPKKALK